MLDRRFGLGRAAAGCHGGDAVSRSLSHLRCPQSHAIEATPWQSAVMDVRFSPFPQTSTLASTVCDDGLLLLMEASSRPKILTSSNTHNNIVFSTEWLSPDSLLVSSGDHSISMWRIDREESVSLIRSSIFQRHFGGVKALAAQRGHGSIFASGGRDTLVNIWDLRCNKSCTDSTYTFYYKPVISIPNCHNNPHTQLQPVSKKARTTNCTVKRESLSTVTGLVFPNERHVVSCAAADSSVNVWDIRFIRSHDAPAPYHVFSQPDSNRKNGYSSIVHDSRSTFVLASCTDGNIYQWDYVQCVSREGSKTTKSQYSSKYVNPKFSSYHTKIDISPCGDMIVSGSESEEALIWKMGHEKPFASLSGHTGTLSCVAWNKFDHMSLITAAEDRHIACWSPNFSRHPHDAMFGSINITAFPQSSTLIANPRPRIPVQSKTAGSSELAAEEISVALRNSSIKCDENPRSTSCLETPCKKPSDKNCASEDSIELETPVKGQSGCIEKALRNLPDYVKSPFQQIPSPKAPPTPKSALTDRILTPSPRKRFMSNFKSAFTATPPSRKKKLKTSAEKASRSITKKTPVLTQSAQKINTNAVSVKRKLDATNFG